MYTTLFVFKRDALHTDWFLNFTYISSRSAAGDRHGSVSEADSDEENEEGDYTVYECPGLAPVRKLQHAFI